MGLLIGQKWQSVRKAKPIQPKEAKKHLLIKDGNSNLYIILLTSWNNNKVINI
jgi:hypothetical protein